MVLWWYLRGAAPEGSSLCCCLSYHPSVCPQMSWGCLHWDAGRCQPGLSCSHHPFSITFSITSFPIHPSPTPSPACPLPRATSPCHGPELPTLPILPKRFPRAPPIKIKYCCQKYPPRAPRPSGESTVGRRGSSVLAAAALRLAQRSSHWAGSGQRAAGLRLGTPSEVNAI